MKRVAIFTDGSENDIVSLKSASTIAAALDARLSVFHVRLPYFSVVESLGSPVVADNSEQTEEMARRARKAYDQVFVENVGECEFREVEAMTLADFMGTSACYYDVVIIERVSNEEGPDVEALNCALFDYAGPVVIVPPTLVKTIGTHVALAWNGQGQSMRAIRAALPVLEKAEKISVLTQDQNADDRDEFERFLSANGLAVDWHGFGGARMAARQRGRALLQKTGEVGADLLVMGAFGTHGLSRIFGLGRATQKVVTACKVPVLLHP